MLSRINLSKFRSIRAFELDLTFRWLLVVGICLYLALFLYNSITRTREFPPDSMNYVDVARNISSGKGIVQSTLGFNQPFILEEDSQIPTPLTSQPPLYPILIAMVSCFGLDHTDAALVITAISYGFILLLAYFLSKELYGERIAIMSVAFLLVYGPLTYVARFALTEPIAMAFLILSLWLLIRYRQVNEGRVKGIITFLIGLTIGLTFITRYAFLPLFFLGILFLVIERRKKKYLFGTLVYYLIGFGIPALLVLGHNFLSSGSIMPNLLPSDRGLVLNLRDIFVSIFAHYLWVDAKGMIQVIIAFMVLIIFLIALIIHPKMFNNLQAILIRDGRYVLTLWSLGYLSFILYQRTIYHFNRLDTRFIASAGVILVILGIALFSKVVGPKMDKYAFYLALALFLLAFGREVGVTFSHSAYNFQEIFNQSERLRWVAQNTSQNDLIIGDGTMDIPFYLGRSAVVSFSPYPYTNRLEYKKLVNYIRKNCHKYKNVYMLIRANEMKENDLMHLYGTFITDILTGRIEQYPDIVLHKRLKDAYVFKVLSCH